MRLLVRLSWEDIIMPNGIYIQTEYQGRLIRKIVCNGEERWFIGSNCTTTFATLRDCMAAIDRLPVTTPA